MVLLNRHHATTWSGMPRPCEDTLEVPTDRSSCSCKCCDYIPGISPITVSLYHREGIYNCAWERILCGSSLSIKRFRTLAINIHVCGIVIHFSLCRVEGLSVISSKLTPSRKQSAYFIFKHNTSLRTSYILQRPEVPLNIARYLSVSLSSLPQHLSPYQRSRALTAHLTPFKL